MARDAYRAVRCEHGCLERMCAARNCWAWDGHRAPSAATHTRNPRGSKRLTLKCRCGRRVPRELLDEQRKCPGCEPSLSLSPDEKSRIGGANG